MAELYDRPNKVDRHSAKIQELATAARGVSSIEFSTRRSKRDVEICYSTILPSLSIPPSATSSLLDGLFHVNHPVTNIFKDLGVLMDNCLQSQTDAVYDRALAC